MTTGGTEKKSRGPRGKRAPRVDEGEKIVVRVSKKEKDQLKKAAGSLTLSTFVRNTLISGRPAGRRELQAIAALHAVGKRIDSVASKVDGKIDRVVTDEILRTLMEIRLAIAELSEAMPGKGPQR